MVTLMSNEFRNGYRDGLNGYEHWSNFLSGKETVQQLTDYDEGYNQGVIDRESRTGNISGDNYGTTGS